jgi:trigger factor
MNITITDQEHCKKEVRLEIPAEVVRARFDQAAQEYARSIALPGFRPGRVPASVVKSRFRKELRNEVASQILPDALREAVTEKGLKVVGEPSLLEFAFGDDELLSATFSVETAPDFELSNYKGIPLTKNVYKVRDEEVQKALDNLREEHAEMVPVEDRSAQEGDVITANMTVRYLKAENKADAGDEVETGETSGEEEAKSEAAEEASEEATANEEVQELTDQEIVLGSDGIGKQITEALTGANAGDTREFTIDYPADYSYEQLAGSKVNYKTEITAIRFKEMPEANDEFAKGVDEKYNSIEELRAELRSNLEKAAEAESNKELRAAAVLYLTDNNRFEVPEIAVEMGIRQGLRAFISQFRSRGIPIDLREEDVERMKGLMRPQAETDARMAFILDRIVELEQIEVTDEEVEHEIEHIAEANDRPLAAVKAQLTKEGAIDTIKDQIKTRKALDIVIASAQIETEEVEGVEKKNDSESQEGSESQESSENQGSQASEGAGE